jgi:hypothetical protein
MSPRSGSTRKARVAKVAPASPIQPISGPPVLTPITFKEADLKVIRDEALKNIAAKMKVNVADLPASVKDTAAKATQDILDARTKAMIQRDVEAAVKAKINVGADAMAQLSGRMAAASQGLQLVAGDANVNRVLKDTAQLLYKKYRYLVEAGFTQEQAFSLLQAEVAGRAGRNR